MSPLPVRMTWKRLPIVAPVCAFAPSGKALLVPAFFPRSKDPLVSAIDDNGRTARKSAAERSAPAVRRYDQDCAFAGSDAFCSSSGALYAPEVKPSLRLLKKTRFPAA